jgi:3-isopropylmalate/(R)-2-methylmalate dehydratase small subunit
MEKYTGGVLFLDRSDINTDEIIPAKYLTTVSKEALKAHLLEDLSLPGFSQAEDILSKLMVVSRKNFGCGSSREHAPWALEANGIRAVAAVNFARIFRQNMFNCGMLALELKEADIDELFILFGRVPTKVTIDVRSQSLSFSGGGTSKTVGFSLAPFDQALFEAGGWIEYADRKY